MVECVIELVRPTVDLADSWWAMVDAFAGEHLHGSGFGPADRERLRDDPEAVEAWVDWLAAEERSGTALPAGRVACSYRWIVEDGHVLGAIAVRHALTDVLLGEGGHIGYSVSPTARRRRVATTALSLALGMAAARGIDPVLVTCDVDNVASARTIERNGGVLEDVRGGTRRYWVPTRPDTRALCTDPVETRLAPSCPHHPRGGAGHGGR